ncbi:MAG: SGNH/GDSL hydrolase family protein, partial [Bacteroidales bacterium]
SIYFSAIPLVSPSISKFTPDGYADERSSYQPFSSISCLPDLDHIADLLKQNNPLIWVFTGDSITHGAKHTHGYRSYPEIFEERIRWEMNRRRDVIINTGISGNTTMDILRDFDWRIGQFKPNVVSLMIGTNDCSKEDIPPAVFERNIDSLLAIIRGLNSIPVFQTPNFIIKEKAPERVRLSEYVSVIRNIAGEKKVILIDNYAYWQKEIQDKGEALIFRKWLNDPLHPNGAGHSEIARLIFRELNIFDPQAPTCGGAYYEGEH